MTIPVVIAYSGGGQSRSMLEMILRGVVERPKTVLVAFADTGGEHGWTYREVDEVEGLCRESGIPFLRCSAETSLEADLLSIPSGALSRLEHPPFHIDKGTGRGTAGQRCTYEYKVAPQRRAVSAWLAAHDMKKQVEWWIGFAADEAHRAQKAAQNPRLPKWTRLRFPLLERGWRKSDVSAFLGRQVPFSMCVFCPYKSVARHMLASDEDKARAVAVDDAIRDLDCIGLTEGPAYVSDQLIPLRDLLRDGGRQRELPYFGCTGGACFL